jgi:hypothetical protein
MAAPSDATRRPRGAGSFTQQRQSRGPAIRQPPARHLTEDTQQPSITKPAQQPGRPTSINKRRLRPRARAPAFAGAFGDLQACHGSDAGHTLERFAPWLCCQFRRKSPRCIAIRMRLSDLRPRFVCKACGKRGADVRPDFHWKEKPVAGMGYRWCPIGASR